MPKSLPNRFRFTDLAIARLKSPTTGEVIWWDTLLVGLGCRISKTGRKTWCVAIGGGKRRLGTFPELSVANARAEARELMEGGVEQAARCLFHTIVDDFLRHGRTRKGRELRQNTVDQYRRVFARYAVPLHKRPFAEITRRDVASVLRDVAATSGAPTASLVRSMLARLWSYAIGAGECEFNIVQHTPNYEIAKRSRVLTDGELRALWVNLLDAEEYHMIVKLLLWTGARRGEVGGMRWSEIQNSTWTIPGARTKNHRELILPLPRQAQEAVATWHRVVGKDTLFGAYSSRGFNNWAAAKKRLDAQLQFRQPWCLHDLRRSCETRLASLGVSKEVRSRLLNHDIGDIAQSYDHYNYDAEKQSALQLWADKLEEIVQEHKPRVVKMRRASVK